MSRDYTIQESERGLWFVMSNHKITQVCGSKKQAKIYIDGLGRNR